MSDIQEMQRQSNAAMKRLRTSENRLASEADEVLSLLNARIRNLENIVEKLDYELSQAYNRISELERQVNRVPGSIPGDYIWDELVGNDGK